MPCPYHTLKILWTPVSTGVTTFYEIIKFYFIITLGNQTAIPGKIMVRMSTMIITPI